MKNLVYLFVLLLTFPVFAQRKEAPSWVDFAKKKAANNLENSQLLDYSFAGYKFSEKPLPNVSSWRRISVLDHGATRNDNKYDDAAIQSAINAAKALKVPTVVYFPAGRYLISSNSTKNNSIRVDQSNIVLKGAGSGKGGTVIHADKLGDVSKKWNTPWKFLFEASGKDRSKVATVTKKINRGDTKIQVSNASKLKVGMVVMLTQNGAKENIKENLGSLKLKPVWTINKDGLRVSEGHLITRINGNTVTFKNPVNCVVTAGNNKATLVKYPAIEDVGIEDILFTSGWKSYPEKYVHHKNDVVDYGWRAVKFSSVRNGWIRNVEFKDWVECLQISNSMSVTAKDIRITGKQGHSSYMASTSTGILFDNCRDLVPTGFRNAGGQGHGPGLQVRSTGCVFLNCGMQKNQSIDCHGYQPYGNLMDNVSGGTFENNGGAERSAPHSGPDHLFWNFTHESSSGSKQINFWDLSKRTLHYFVKPKLVGFRSPGKNITFRNDGLNELKGQRAYPSSLFDAQLQLRMLGGYMSASSEKNPGSAKKANDNKTSTHWESKSSGGGQWLMIDFGVPKTFKSVTLNEVNKRIDDWKLEYWNGNSWEILKSGSKIGGEKVISFNSVQTRKIRFTVISMVSGSKNSSVSISRFKLGGSSVATNQKPTVEFTNPKNDIEVFEGYSSLEVVVKASDSDGSVNFVNLYVDDKFIRQEKVVPYEWGHDTSPNIKELTGLKPGSHKIRAVATDNKGAEGTDTFTLIVKKKTTPSETCNFGTPSTSGIGNIDTAYDTVYKVGKGGPDISKIRRFSINFSATYNDLYQFAINTTDGLPAYYVDFSKSMQFQLKNRRPEITLSNTKVNGLDGSYWVTQTADSFILVSKSKGYSIHFSTSNTKPTCNKNLDPGVPSTLKVYPIPVENELIIDNISQDIVKVELFDNNGKKLRNIIIQDQSTVRVDAFGLARGIYFVKAISNSNKSQVVKFIK